MYLLQEKENRPNQDFGGGGGVILPSRNSRITSVWNHQIYAQMTDVPWDYKGMINDLVQQSDFPTGDKLTNELDYSGLKINGSHESYQR
jgi:methylmalonyl-CoA mutase